jgi:ATP-dependent RNA helicase HelY
MPARSCVISSFTKFDGVSFASLTSGELTQLMGRAGRRGIDTVGHGVILKESDVDLRDIYDAAISGEFAVDSKFSPTYTMVLNLLRTRSAEAAELLLDSSFGQYQAVERSARWEHRKANLEAELHDLRLRRFQHPRVPCTERTLSSFLTTTTQLGEAQLALRRVRRGHWTDARRGRYGKAGSDPGQRYEALRRSTRSLQERLNESPCRNCPYFGEHRAHHHRIADIETTLAGAEEELERSQHRFRREFRAHRAVLRAAGFLDGDEPTDLGRLAGSLYGESSLLVADAIASGVLDGLKPEELAATLVSLVAEDRGRERPQPSRRHFPTPRIEERHRRLRTAMRRFVELEREHGLETMPPLSLEQIRPAYEWASGVPLADIEPPPGADTGDVVKAVKSLYSLLRQMEQALRGHALHPVVTLTRERVERDLIRRI